jgi:chromosome segregation ATPase
MAFTGIVFVLAEVGAWRPVQQQEALDNLPMTVDPGAVQELAEAATHRTVARLEMARDAEVHLEAVLHRTAARLAEERDAAAALVGEIHTTAALLVEARTAEADLEAAIHTMAAQLGVARGVEEDLEAAMHTMAAQLGVARGVEEDLEAAMHTTVAQPPVEVECHAESEGLRIQSGVEEGAVHRIPADAAGPVDQVA